MDLVPLPWDSELFGFSIAKVEGRPDPSTLSTSALAAGIRCVYYFCPSDDLEAIRAAEESGFQLTDIRVLLRADATQIALDRHHVGSGELDVDVARADDSEALQEIAAELSVYSRFAFDPRFGVGQARRLYDRWLKVSLEGRADLFVVARNAGRAVGFVACRVNKHLASLELVAVRSTAVGAGVGTALLHRAARSLRALGCQTVEVITQDRNHRALGFYEGLGFRVRQVSLVYHGWFDPESAI